MLTTAKHCTAVTVVVADQTHAITSQS